jgi:hypothetical protein
MLPPALPPHLLRERGEGEYVRLLHEVGSYMISRTSCAQRQPRAIRAAQSSASARLSRRCPRWSPAAARRRRRISRPQRPWPPGPPRATFRPLQAGPRPGCGPSSRRRTRSSTAASGDSFVRPGEAWAPRHHATACVRRAGRTISQRHDGHVRDRSEAVRADGRCNDGGLGAASAAHRCPLTGPYVWNGDSPAGSLRALDSGNESRFSGRTPGWVSRNAITEVRTSRLAPGEGRHIKIGPCSHRVRVGVRSGPLVATAMGAWPSSTKPWLISFRRFQPAGLAER